MRKYILDNYQEQLTHQVIHMDQAVCYNPEYRATGKLHDYPSRKLQLARAVYKDELPVNDYIGDLVYSYILSRQGERWQNFREDPEDCTDSFILCREMLLKKGYDAPAVHEFRKLLEEKKGHVYDVHHWQLPVDPDSDTFILIDDAAGCGYAEYEEALAGYCEKNALSFVNEAYSVFLGFEYFAYGLVEEGIRHLRQVIEAVEKSGAKRVLVLSAQAKYMLTTMASKTGIDHELKVVYLPEIMKPIHSEKKTYVYAGSFNSRYLCNSEFLNALIPNEQEEQNKQSLEFIPLLKADQRVNRLTMWQRPIAAGYKLFGVSDAITDAIRKDAISDIRKADFDQIIVFEAKVLRSLREEFPDKQVESYLKYL